MKQETIFSGLLRHTFEEPRDLMVLGQALYKLPPNERSNEAIVSKVVNQTTNVILSDYLQYMGEVWDSDLAALTFREISCNILPRHVVETIAAKVAHQSKEKIQHPFCYLYSLGLIGVPVPDGDTTQMRQEFLLPARFPRKGINDNSFRYRLPEADYYFIHPALTERIRSVRLETGFLFTTHGEEIVGDGRPWDKHIELMRVSLRRYLAPDGAAINKLISLTIDSCMLGYDEDIPGKKGSFSSLEDSGTFIFVAMLLALQKKRLAQEEDKAATEISIDQFSEAAEFLFDETLRTKTGTKRRKFGDKFIAEVENYLGKRTNSKKYPNSLSTIKSRLKAAGIQSIEVGIRLGNLFIDGIPPDEIRIKGFGKWDV